MGTWQARSRGVGAVLLVCAVGWGCRATEPAIPSSEPTPRAAAQLDGDAAPVAATDTAKTPSDPQAPEPGFVVLTAEGTLVIPLDAAAPTFVFPGLAVGADEGAYGHRDVEVVWAPPAPAGGAAPAGAFRMPYCVDETSACRHLDPDGSAAGIVRTDASGSTAVFPGWGSAACDCIPIEGVSTDPRPPLDRAELLADPELVEEMSLSLYSEDEYIEYCVLGGESPEDGTEFDLSSVMGGVLYETGMGHEGSCSGLNIYTGDMRKTPLRPGATPRETEVPRGALCSFDSFSDALLPEVMLEAPKGDDGSADCLYGDSSCDGCSPDEAVAYMIVNGQLVQADGEIDSVGVGCSCVSAQPIGPTTCVSAFDTCGRATRFPSVEGATSWWVDSREHAALLRREAVLEVRVSPDDAVRRSATSPGDILGVEFHPDLAPLRRLRAPEKILVGAPDLDASDRDLDDTTRAWGNRCFAHLKAGRLDSAEAACVEALRQGGSSKSRGAATYNLGRVAEARGDRNRAAAYYRRSLRLRPGNDVVQQRLDRLDAAPE